MSNLLGYRPYVSSDLEFSGVGDKQAAVIFEMSFIFDDGRTDGYLKDLPHFHCMIDLPVITYAEPYAMAVNAPFFAKYKAWKDTGNSPYTWLKPKEAITELIGFIQQCTKEAIQKFDSVKGWDKPMNKIQVAGKNFDSADRNVLEGFFMQHAPQEWAKLNKLLDYKSIDIGSQYEAMFGYNCSLSEINKMTGRTEVTHEAYEDAMDVIVGKRFYWCKVHGLDFAGTTKVSEKGLY